MQDNIRSSLKNKNAASLFASDDRIESVIISVKSDLASLPAEISGLISKGKQARVDGKLVASVVSILQSEVLEAGRDYGKLIEKHAHATKAKEDKRNKYDIDRPETGIYN